MATLRFHDTNERLEGGKVETYLNDQGVIYENWSTDKLPSPLVEKYTLSEVEKEKILEVYANEIADISERRGYLTADVISLSSATPKLEDLLKNFKQEHHHTDDEVRYIVSGHGIFAIEGKDGRFFDVELEPGDLISVPENYRHYFTLQEDRQVVAIRIFKTKEGWVPVYDRKEEVK
ncbi:MULTISPECIES: 1,2-dihydroxy-3-keto-5-methylthiopentene dioxygenase [Alkalihalophilus]|uniref:Acireductone dioxygenase n=1 Tax=Alkalihalophilus pseudofirmus (strain ATCC BAA-2126 / JCM 17055 / OF4) TaxID=398511 RepID=D3FZB8_ALKPO|nr:MULTISPECIES: cupin domain-containing protein [Alkalihalophilus]ADC50987.1 acireductone dioxygenase ARD [Alkalihalophilus pseudofirmus OF4]MEC2070672.1 cupin domain-containing protein [Alkalihalophilus marmarensis]